VYPGNAFEVRIACRCRKLHIEFAVRLRNPGRQEEIERDGEQCDDRGVIRHDNILGYSDLAEVLAIWANAATPILGLTEVKAKTDD
jgi:hypothetical protein